VTIDFETRVSKKAKRPRIDVNIRGVTVVVPKGSGLDPEELVEKKRDWVEEKVEKYRQHREKIPARQFNVGAEWPYLGEMYELQLKENRRDIHSNTIILPRKQVKKKTIKDELEKFYRERARDRFKGLTEKWAKALNVRYNKIYIRNQRTKWGSCSSKGNISFNFRLMMAPPEISKYIVIHELCHLKHPNHGKKFYRELQYHSPNHSAHEQWLEENSVRLIFTRDDL